MHFQPEAISLPHFDELSPSTAPADASLRHFDTAAFRAIDYSYFIVKD